MKTKLTLISIAACSAALFANTGGVPKIENRVADLEQLALIQAQEIQSLKAKIEEIKPSPFTEIEAARLKYQSSGMIYIRNGDEMPGGWDGWIGYWGNGAGKVWFHD